MDNTILYNPDCSKSLSLLNAPEIADFNFKLRNYLLKPLNKTELIDLLSNLKLENPLTLLRSSDTSFNASGNNANLTNMIADSLVASPELLQRPIIILNRNAIIARPPSIAIDFLNRYSER